jgi:GxxExxY protein
MVLTRVQSSLSPELENLIEKTIGCLITVHRELGSGLAEGAYARAIRIELQSEGIPFESEKPIHVHYKGQLVCSQRLDLLLDDQLIVEIKSVERIHSAHVAQVVSYLRATGKRAGLVVNFNAAVLRDGIRRVVL